MTYAQKLFKRLKRRLLRKQSRPLLVIGVLVAPLLSIAVYSSVMPKYIDPSAYRGLLNTIAEGESNGNYNAYFANSANSSLKLTDMTIAEVLQWQTDYVQAGNASNAAGRYQIIQPTLEGLVKELHIHPSTKFDEAMQDKMAITLMERRGSIDFAEAKISSEQFVANLAKEWAALPAILGDSPTESFYAGDGLNEARIPVETILQAVREFQRLAE